MGVAADVIRMLGNDAAEAWHDIRPYKWIVVPVCALVYHFVPPTLSRNESNPPRARSVPAHARYVCMNLVMERDDVEELKRNNDLDGYGSFAYLIACLVARSWCLCISQRSCSTLSWRTARTRARCSSSSSRNETKRGGETNERRRSIVLDF